MPTRKSSSSRKSTSRGRSKVRKVMREYKRGELKAGRGRRGKVKSRKQAVAIALSEARSSGAKIPRKRSSSSRKK
jgi:uncharacterized protein DUF6496